MWRSGNLPKLLVFILRRHKKWHSDIINIFLQTFCQTPSVYHLWSFKKKQHKCLELPNRTLNSTCTFSSCRMQFYLQTHCFESTNAATFKIRMQVAESERIGCRKQNETLRIHRWKFPNTSLKISEYKLMNTKANISEQSGKSFQKNFTRLSENNLKHFPNKSCRIQTEMFPNTTVTPFGCTDCHASWVWWFGKRLARENEALLILILWLLKKK